MLDIDGVGRVRRDGRRDERIAAPGGGEFLGERETAVGLGRVGRGEVNHGLAEHGAHAGLFHDGGEFLLEVVAIHHRGDAALDHFDDAVESAPVNELAVHEIFIERENESPQPVRHIVAEAAEDGHRGVRMGVDHTREDEVAAGVDGFGRRELRGERGGPNGDNARAANDDGTVLDDFTARVHRHDVAVRDDEVGALERGLSQCCQRQNEHGSGEDGGQKAHGESGWRAMVARSRAPRTPRRNVRRRGAFGCGRGARRGRVRGRGPSSACRRSSHRGEDSRR